MAAKRFLGLDGLRGICALTVLLFHGDGLLRDDVVMDHGFLAVDLFFLLSGFVIALTHEARLRAGAGVRKFLQSRARRLMPVYWLAALFNILIFVWMASAGYYPHGYTSTMIWIVVPLLTLLMLPVFGTPGSDFSPSMMNVSWSLLVEWLVNIAYAMGPFRWKTRTLFLAAVAGWLAMAIAGYFTGNGWCVGMTRYDVFTWGLLRGAPSFLAGVVIYRLHNHHLFARLPVVAPELLLTLWLCVAVVPTYAATPTFDWIVVTLICPALVMLLIRSDHKAPAWCRTLGELSYPLYVIHPGILLLTRVMPPFGLPPGAGRAFLVIAGCLACAWLLQALVSLPRLRPGRIPAKIPA